MITIYETSRLSETLKYIFKMYPFLYLAIPIWEINQIIKPNINIHYKGI